MNWVDIAVLTVVAFSALLGFMRGMVREVLGLAAWIGAGFAATWFFPQFQGVSRRLIENQDIADPVTFGVIFLVVLIVFSLVARAVGVPSAARSWADWTGRWVWSMVWLAVQH